MTAPTSTPPSAIVRSTRPGECVSIDGQTYMLYSACGAPAPELWCVTHALRLANQGQLEMHTEPGSGEHVIAAKCAVHGWEACR
ncbi:MAG: hypothetical protein ACHQWU_15525 [Gemmatimonadales bacterium]